MVGIFQPLVPAIAGAGVLKALMVLLSTLGVMSSGDIAYKVFVGVADAALYYLPVMVAFTTATKFNCNKLVAVALAAAMIHPSVSRSAGYRGRCLLPRHQAAEHRLRRPGVPGHPDRHFHVLY